MKLELVYCALRALEQYEDNLRDTLSFISVEEEEAINHEIILTNEAMNALSLFRNEGRWQ